MNAKRSGADSLPGTNSENSLKEKGKSKDRNNNLYLIYCYCLLRFRGESHKLALWAISNRGIL